MSDNDAFAYPATLEEWRKNPLEVRDYEVGEATDSTPQSLSLILTLKDQAPQGILDGAGTTGSSFSRSRTIN